MIDLIGGVGALSRLTSSNETDMAAAAGLAQTQGLAGAAPSRSFSDVLQTLGEDVMTNLKVAEGQSFAAVRGEAATREVVDAIMSAEQSLQTAVAIRDKLVTAYLEIARMQI